ncbi:MAG: Hsp20/alpha crystallin family protein [Chloroflexi bacterium]|nr:MAG: Hsp20/alpha crystallin family protein [Chloroflexota bacterium]
MDRTFWDQMASLENRMEATFRSLGLWTPGRGGFGPLPERPFAPALDVIARNGDLVYRIDLPGIDPAKDLVVTAEGDALTIHGERRETAEVEQSHYYREESFKGTFERHVPLPAGTHADRITAQYADGVLEIVVPNTPKPHAEVKPRKIPVRTPVLARV